MLERLLIAGSGGQGVLLIGKLLAHVAANEVPHVTFFPSYGVEVRGGTSNCQIILSSDEIASPVPEEVDSMIIMNQASLDKFADRGAGKCLTLVNSYMCKAPGGQNVLAVNATEMANGLGNTCVANFILLGAYQARRPIVSNAGIEHGIRETFAGKNKALADLNIHAFRAGLKT